MAGALRVVAAAAACAALAGCVTATTKEALTVSTPGFATIAGTVGVTAANGQAPSIPVLKSAIEDSITQSKLFRSVVQVGSGDYELAVFVWNVRTPVMGVSMKVDVELGWTLVRASDKSVVLKKVITTTHTAAGSEAFAGVERTRIAERGAIQENIRQGLRAIADLKL